MNLKSYEAKHHFLRFPIEGGSFESAGRSFEDAIEGPIFPYFLEADFLTLEGFIEFADGFGLAQFEQLDGNDKLKKYLDPRKNKDLPAPVSKKYLREFWKGMEKTLLQSQAAVNGLFQLQQSLQKNRRQLVDLQKVAAFLEEHTRPRIDIPLAPVLAASLKQEVKAEWEYDSITARCLAEIFWLIVDEKKLKSCKLCQKPFVTHRKNEDYCNRFFLEGNAWARFRKLVEDEGLSAARAFLARQTCKKVGPQKTRKKSEEEKQRKKLHDRKNYLRKKVNNRTQGEELELKELTKKLERK